MEIKEFVTFKQYIGNLKIKEATKKKYLANLKEDNKPNHCAITVLNHYNKYVMNIIPIVDSPVMLEARERGLIQDGYDSIKDLQMRVTIERNRLLEIKVKELQEKVKNLENNR